VWLILGFEFGGLYYYFFFSHLSKYCQFFIRVSHDFHYLRRGMGIVVVVLKIKYSKHSVHVENLQSSKFLYN